MNSIVLNITLFKLGWLAAVLSAAASLPILGTATVAVVAAVHLLRAENSKGELQLLLVAAAFGFIWESLLVSAGFVQYKTGTAIAGLAPYWIVAMWVLFATTLNVSMRWLRKSLLLASIMGAVGGPLSFLAGQKAGAVAFPDTWAALLAIGLGWAVLLPLIVRYAARDENLAVATA